MTVWALLVVAGLSETAGRIVPLVVRRHHASRASVIRLLLAGTVVEAMVFALWPLVGWILAESVRDGPPYGAAPTWTTGSAAPLLLTGTLAFPLLGPALHFVVLVLAGTALAGDLAAASRLDWWSALACVACSGVVLAVLVGCVRRSVGAWGSAEERVWAR
jgi:hypothetical protein